MNRAKYIVRGVFFLAAVFLVFDLNKKTDDNVKSVVEFKLRMLQQLRTDSLDSKHKLDMVVNETTKYIDDSSHVKKGLDYLRILLAVIIVTEVVFLVMEKRNPGR